MCDGYKLLLHLCACSSFRISFECKQRHPRMCWDLKKQSEAATNKFSQFLERGASYIITRTWKILALLGIPKLILFSFSKYLELMNFSRIIFFLVNIKMSNYLWILESKLIAGCTWSSVQTNPFCSRKGWLRSPQTICCYKSNQRVS